MCGAANGIYYSNDRGHTWVRAQQGLPSSSPGVSFLVSKDLILAGTITKQAAAPIITIPPPPRTETNSSRRPRVTDAQKVHDPSTILGEDGVYRFFATGPGVSLLRESTDGSWQPEGRIFAEDDLPEWHHEQVPGNRGYLWAPDVIRVGDSYFVYYSVSTFGTSRLLAWR